MRGFITRADDGKLAEYQPLWSDEQVLNWDGDFKDDGASMLVCGEQDVEVPDFRNLLGEWMEYRDQASLS